MKQLLAIAVFVMACGGGSKKAETTTTDPNTSTSSGDPGAPPTGEGTPCEQEIALVCPDGQIDGCLKTPQEGTSHACVAK